MLDIATLRERRANGEKGFTLIELLVVVVIIGILIAIAVPVYLNYKKGAADKSAMSDLRNAITTLEQCQTNTGDYPTLDNNPFISETTTVCGNQSITTSSGTILVYYHSSAGSDRYLLLGWNVNGSMARATSLNELFSEVKPVYCYASAQGGQVRTTSVSVIASASSEGFSNLKCS